MEEKSCVEEVDLGVTLRSALRIDDIDQLRLSPTERISIMWVDLSERPDLAALAARDAPEPSDASVTLFSDYPGTPKMLVGLRVSLKQPMTAVFTLVFPVEQFAGHLVTMAKYGKLWIVPGPPLPRLVGTGEMEAQTLLTQIVRYSGQGVWLELESPLMRAVRTQLDE